MQQIRSLQDPVDKNGIEDADASARHLSYWDNLRNSSAFETRSGSAVFRVNTGSEVVRLAHILSIHPYSVVLADGARVPVHIGSYTGASKLLAMHHFNERSPGVLPELPALLGDCNVYMTMDIVDTMLSPIVASRQALNYFVRPHGSLSKPFPVSLSGASRSAVTQPLSVLAGVYHMPVVNGQSTSPVLDSKDSSPTFTRTIPTNRVDAEAVVTYFKSLGVTHFGVLFVRDTYGSEFNRVLNSAAAEVNISIVSAAYDDGNLNTVIGALEKLRRSEYRYFFAVLTSLPETHEFVIHEASKLGMMGNPEYVWFYGEGSALLLDGSFLNTKLNSSLESDREMAAAMRGSGLVLLNIPQHEPFHEALRDLGHIKELYDYFVSRHDSPEMFTDFHWDPIPSFYFQFAYDAIISLGIGLCNMTEEFPSGPTIVDAIKATEFMGTSGKVSYDSFTGTRATGSVSFEVINLLVDPSPSLIVYELQTSAHINLSSREVEVLSPFVYADGTVEPPLWLSGVTVDLNLIVVGFRIAGWTLAGIVILVSIGLGCWTFHYRNKHVIRVSQPVFLGLLCVGTILMASTIIPMSFQEPMTDDVLDRACMAMPWLFVIGFATAFSSLFCKLLRINKVFRESADMRRVEVKAKDVMLPFVILFVANFSVLLAWTLVAPLRWTRVEVANYDQFGRSLESYGTCFATGQSGSSEDASARARTAFLVALGLFNFIAVAFANYQCYVSRHVPSDFNESYYIGISMLFILEGFLLGVPILFLVVGNPTANFIVGSLLISFLCMAMLVPTFGSKVFIKRRSKLRMSKLGQAWKNYDGTSRKRHQAQAETLRARGNRNPGGSGINDSSVAAIRARVARSASAQAGEKTPPVNQHRRNTS